MEEVKSPVTPRRIYYQSNICILCGFSFIQTEVLFTGQIVQKKYLNKKLKLTEERIKNITIVVSDFEPEPTSINGVCVKCYRHIEKVIQMQTDLSKMQKDLTEARHDVRKAYKLTCSRSAKKTEKRLHMSPLLKEQHQIKHQKTTFISEFSVVHLLTIPTFDEMIQVPQVPSTSSQASVKPVRRSLGFSDTVTSDTGKEYIQKQGPNLEGEVKVHIKFSMYIFIHKDVQENVKINTCFVFCLFL